MMATMVVVMTPLVMLIPVIIVGRNGCLALDTSTIMTKNVYERSGMDCLYKNTRHHSPN